MPKWTSLAAISRAPGEINRALDRKADEQGRKLADSIMGLFSKKRRTEKRRRKELAAEREAQALRDYCGIDKGADWGSNGW